MHGQGAMLVQAAEVDAAPAVPPAAAAQPAPLRPALRPRHEGVHHHLRSGGTVDTVDTTVDTVDTVATVDTVDIVYMVPRGLTAPRCGAPCVWRSVSPWWRLRHSSPAGMEITGGCSRISRVSSHRLLTAITRLLCLYFKHVHCCTRMPLMSLYTIYQSLYANILHYAALCSTMLWSGCTVCRAVSRT